MQRILQYLLLSIITITISCNDDNGEIIPEEKEPQKPKVISLNPAVGLPGDTVTITLDNPDSLELTDLSISDYPAFAQILSTSEVKTVIPTELTRSEKAIIKIGFKDFTIQYGGFSMASVIISSISHDTIAVGDTLIIIGDYFDSEINEVFIGKEEYYNQDDYIFLDSFEPFSIERNLIKIHLNSLHELERFQNYKLGIYVGGKYYVFDKDLHYTLKVRKASRFNPVSEAPGSLLLFDVFNGSAHDLEIVINQDTLKDPLWTWSYDGYQRAHFETPYNLVPGVEYGFRAFKSGNELMVLNNSILIEEPTYTFSSNTFDRTQSNDITFSLSHVYIGYEYNIRLISQVDGQMAYEWSNSYQIDENVIGDGNGVELTVNAPSYNFDGSYYVQITAGLESYELSPAGNNVITFE